MTTRLLKFEGDCGFCFEATDEWQDTTDETKGPARPYTLTKARGVGALQFSVASYMSGPVPLPSSAKLLAMAEESGMRSGAGMPFDTRAKEGRLSIAAADFHTPEDNFLRVWYVSDGKNIMLITYVAKWELREIELLECEGIVESVRFDS
jgi:hypothetical protein